MAAAAVAAPMVAPWVPDNPLKQADMGMPVGALMSHGLAAVAAALVPLAIALPLPLMTRQTEMGDAGWEFQ